MKNFMTLPLVVSGVSLLCRLKVDHFRVKSFFSFRLTMQDAFDTQSRKKRMSCLHRASFRLYVDRNKL